MGESNPLGAAIGGGAVLAIWLYGLLFGFGNEVGWLPWFWLGLLGFSMGACVYGLRFANPTLRIVLAAAVGMILVFLILGAMLEEVIELWAAFITGLASSIIATALPLPTRGDG